MNDPNLHSVGCDDDCIELVVRDHSVVEEFVIGRYCPGRNPDGTPEGIGDLYIEDLAGVLRRAADELEARCKLPKVNAG